MQPESIPFRHSIRGPVRSGEGQRDDEVRHRRLRGKTGPGYNLFHSKFAPGANSSCNARTTRKRRQQLRQRRDGRHDAHGVRAGQIPVKHAVARQFGVFNKYFCGVPSASTPNHLMIHPACGIVDNIQYSAAAGQRRPSAIYHLRQPVRAQRLVRALPQYVRHRRAPGVPRHGPNRPGRGIAYPTGRGHERRRAVQAVLRVATALRARRGRHPARPQLAAAHRGVRPPVLRHREGRAAAQGHVRGAAGGPKWNSTLLFVVYDDGSGYYDQVIPPSEGVPSDDAPCHLRDQCSPEREKLTSASSACARPPCCCRHSCPRAPYSRAERGPANTSQFEHTSVPATLKKLFNLTGFLTKRDAWAGTFDELLLDAPRADADTPLHLPDAPAPATVGPCAERQRPRRPRRRWRAAAALQRQGAALPGRRARDAEAAQHHAAAR